VRDLVAGVGTLMVVAGALTIWMGQGAPGLGLAAIGACLVWGALRSRP